MPGRRQSLQMTMRYTHVDRSAQVLAANSMRPPLSEEPLE